MLARPLRLQLPLLCALWGLWSACLARDLPALVAGWRDGVVGIAAFDPLGAPRTTLLGTGFVVADGRKVATNVHVVQAMGERAGQRLVVLVGQGPGASVRAATRLREDAAHDLALLQMEGPPGVALALGAPASVAEGTAVAFTGYPLGTALGLYPVTHQGIVSSVVPVAHPGNSLRPIGAAQLKRLRAPFEIYQLDAVAYPGNSGSPVFELDSGHVIAVVNSVLAKASREQWLKNPSAITYAIPVQHLQALLDAP